MKAYVLSRELKGLFKISPLKRFYRTVCIIPVGILKHLISLLLSILTVVFVDVMLCWLSTAGLIFTLVNSKRADLTLMAYSSLSLMRKKASAWGMSLSRRLHRFVKKTFLVGSLAYRVAHERECFLAQSAFSSRLCPVRSCWPPTLVFH